MHRTQISLEFDQYQRLKAVATESHLSLAQLIRRLIDRYLGETPRTNATSPLDRFAGVLEDHDCQSTNFKKFLYTK